jgi:hypothetical protein
LHLHRSNANALQHSDCIDASNIDATFVVDASAAYAKQHQRQHA